MAGIRWNLRKNWLGLTGIMAISGMLALAFTWTAGLIGDHPTTRTFLGASLESFAPGYRRAHGKGICFDGVFRSSGTAASLSIARVFSQAEIPVIGRFSIGSADPHAADNSTSTVGMAVLLTADDQSQWRMKLNNIPYFPTRNPEGVLAQMAAFKPDPASGQPDPERIAAFFEAYPEARKDVVRRMTAPRPASFAGEEYNVVNAFVLIAADGSRQPVRWSMRPHTPIIGLSAQQYAQAGHDFLSEDTARRLAKGPLYWDLVLQLAEAGDPVDDSSQPWPSDRRQVVAGTLEVKRVFDQSDGACRDVNFDPTLVPPGIALSNDPVLAARAGIYSHSYNARLREVGFGKATEAVTPKEGR